MVLFFTKKLFSSSENHQIKPFFKPHNGKTMWNLKCMIELCCVMWVRLSLHMQKRSFRALSYKKKFLCSLNIYQSMVLSMFQTKWRFFQCKQWISRNFCAGAKFCLWCIFVIWNLCKTMHIKGVTAVKTWRKSVIYQIYLYNYGKTTTKFANLETPSYLAHLSGIRFVNIWKG